jgi:predicted nucleotidyltransferase
MEKDLWYEEALKILEAIAKKNSAILSVSLFGSLSKSDVQKDRWSDIDALIIVKD